MSLISVIAPCFNEQETLPELYRQVTKRVESSGHDLELVLVDDGSRDRTPELIEQLSIDDPRVRGVKLSRNFGHEAAIEAGLHEATGDAVVIMDADLQDSPNALLEMITAWEEGADVAYAVRTKRKEGAVLRAAFSGFYRLAGRMMSIELPTDAGPFSLMSRPVVDTLNEMPEHHRYFPGLRAFAGFTQVPIVVERDERLAGETKYSFRKRTAGALNAIMSFSKLPLRAVITLGLISAALSIAGGLYVLIARLSGAGAAPGWASIIVVVLLLAGVQLTTLGIVGEYIGKIYDEVRKRPTFIVSQRFSEEARAQTASRRPAHRGRVEVGEGAEEVTAPGAQPVERR